MNRLPSSRAAAGLRVPKRRAADIAYDTIESMISMLELEPGAPVVEADIVERTGLGRTPVREALLRMTSIGLIEQQPRRGLDEADLTRQVQHLTEAEAVDVEGA